MTHDIAAQTVVVGDVGGHLDFLEAALEAAGWDRQTGLLPRRTTVVLVGDLVHKGPESDACVALAWNLLRNNPHNSELLMGNHEAHYLGGPDLSERNGVYRIGVESEDYLRRLWESGRMKIAHAIHCSEFGATLITHGGLTAGLWRELGSPGTPDIAAEKLNSLPREPSSPVFRPGALLTGEIDFACGPLTPRTGSELAASWLERSHDSLPFSQIHGHEGVFLFDGGQFHGDVPESVKARSALDRERRFSQVNIGKQTLLSIDPVLGVTPPADYQPAVMTLHHAATTRTT
jgi:hypothetical protein